MLIGLHVKNLALIDEAELSFGEGLNILTGETGAGKSVLIGSINLALGQKADREMIRPGCDFALVEMTFQTAQEEAFAILQQEDFEVPEDGVIVISRKIQPSRSVFKINGESANARQVKALAGVLLDIHGQHEHQSLLQKKKHMEILDEYAGEELSALLGQYREVFRELHSKTKELSEASMQEEERLRLLELAAFEVQEIEEAALQPGEDEELEVQFHRMQNARRILEGLGESESLLGYDAEESAGNQLGRALRVLLQLGSLDRPLADLAAELGQVEELLQNVNRGISDYREQLDFGEQDYHDCEDRLNRLNHLKAKYGRTIEDVLDYLEKRREEQEKLLDHDAYMNRLKQEIEKLQARQDAFAEQISNLRQKTAKVLEENLAKALVDLNFLHVDFRVHVQFSPEHGDTNGYDDIEFLISTNPGQEARPLGQVASGGELSRIMLGLKTVLAHQDAIETLIFDEIDAGISGKTAWKVSEKLGGLAKERQILCITHLPQIAAMADLHFFIEKRVQDGMTTTSILPLEKQERIQELARMLGGEESSDAALENARDLIRQTGKNA